MVGGADWQDVPGVGGDHICGDEVDVAGGVGDSVRVEVAFVGVAPVEDGALDLDAGEAGAVLSIWRGQTGDSWRIIFSTTAAGYKEL